MTLKIDWKKYFTDSRSLPLESVRNPKNGLIMLATSKAGLDTYINIIMSEGKDQARQSGTTYGAVEKAKLEKNMASIVDALLEDAEVYAYNPEFYEPYVIEK
ncbi:MAG: hypothetical protein PHG06_11940 [Parabacteroides sp.]|nr:hypothetical protein [Eubacteriales bacterium]MDD4591118.1 hypothetical protein [Parabacteroides sp.]